MNKYSNTKNQSYPLFISSMPCLFAKMTLFDNQDWAILISASVRYFT